MQPEDFMHLAIAEARKSKTPFGAVIVQDGKVIESAGNTVQSDNDPTCHAEVNVIRKLTRRLSSASPSGTYTLYTTCEPCAMCAATCIWAGIQNVVYGVGSDDFSNGNPNLIEVRCEEVLQRSPHFYTLKGGVLKDSCKQLHQEFPIEDL
ncbi:MAG: nucleoside deaminase [Cyanobacteria bacterium P01_H01_bin.119]